MLRDVKIIPLQAFNTTTSSHHSSIRSLCDLAVLACSIYQKLHQLPFLLSSPNHHHGRSTQQHHTLACGGLIPGRCYASSEDEANAELVRIATAKSRAAAGRRSSRKSSVLHHQRTREFRCSTPHWKRWHAIQRVIDQDWWRWIDCHQRCHNGARCT